MSTPISRRNFIKTAGTGSLAALLGAPRNAHAGNTHDRIRVGLIGAGGRGTGAGIIDCAEADPTMDVDGTDAAQSNRNLLLSDKAEVDTKPELEIYADDVKCSHGATVGQLDETALFYLRSRGIDTESARHLLIFAFLRELLGRAGTPALARRMERMLVGGLPEFDELESLL